MTYLEPRFEIRREKPPSERPVIIEVYSARSSDSEQGMGIWYEEESLAEIRDELDDDKLIAESEEELESGGYGFRFDIDNKDIDRYEETLEEVLEVEQEEGLEPVKEASYRIEFYSNGAEADTARFSEETVPEYVREAFIDLQITAFENVKDFQKID